MNEIMSEKAEAMHVNQTVIRLQIETFKKLVQPYFISFTIHKEKEYNSINIY